MEEWQEWQWAVLTLAVLFLVGAGLTGAGLSSGDDYTDIGGGHHTDFDHYVVNDCLYSPSKKKLPDSIFGKPFLKIPDMNPKIEKVGCFDPKANYQILKRIPGDEGSCEGTPGLVTTYTKEIRGWDNYTEYTLCLGDWGT